MDIINLNHGIFLSGHKVKSCVLKLIHTKNMWLFNCCEGCQHTLLENHIKISQISTIILTDLNTDSIAGLLGLLSSLSLFNRKRLLHIYGPPNIGKYINMVKKYAKTNFCYGLYLHILQTGLLIEFDNYRMYAFVKKNTLNLCLYIEKVIKDFNYTKLKYFVYQKVHCMVN